MQRVWEPSILAHEKCEYLALISVWVRFFEHVPLTYVHVHVGHGKINNYCFHWLQMWLHIVCNVVFVAQIHTCSAGKCSCLYQNKCEASHLLFCHYTRLSNCVTDVSSGFMRMLCDTSRSAPLNLVISVNHRANSELARCRSKRGCYP